jgi:myo-inositol-1(or 4)-monophosphatase
MAWSSDSYARPIPDSHRRRSGSAALDLCWVACGRFDAHFEYRLSPWDFAAGMMICAQAGGSCTDAEGKPASLHSRGIVASNGRLHAAVLLAMG